MSFVIMGRLHDGEPVREIVKLEAHELSELPPGVEVFAERWQASLAAGRKWNALPRWLA